MRKTLIVAIALFALTLPPSAATAAPAKVFSSCAKLRAVYPNGVAKSRAAIQLASGVTRQPTVNLGVYRANASRLDRDKDGVACER